MEIYAVVPWWEFRPTVKQTWRNPDAGRKSRTGRTRSDESSPHNTLPVYKIIAKSSHAYGEDVMSDL